MCRWKFQVATVNPLSIGAKWTVGVTDNHYRTICNHGHEKSRARLILVHQVLISPMAIYRGWNRQDQNDGFTYVGSPTSDFHQIEPTIEVPSPPGYLFLVFVHESGKIDHWGWRKKAVGDSSTPEGVEGELLWP